MPKPMLPALARMWGRAPGAWAGGEGEPPEERDGRSAFVDLAIAVGLAGLLYGLSKVGGEWTAQLRQSIPVLGFMPGLVLALVAAFPTSNVGLELAAVLMIFTGQAWNMTFSFYHSLRAVPREQIEVATLYRFGWWRRLRRVELPFATTGLVWNSMMSMAGGWFFLMINEAFQLGDK